MSEVTVSQLAGVIGVPVERLLKQLNEAGIDKADRLKWIFTPPFWQGWGQPPLPTSAALSG